MHEYNCFVIMTSLMIIFLILLLFSCFIIDFFEFLYSPYLGTSSRARYGYLAIFKLERTVYNCTYVPVYVQHVSYDYIFLLEKFSVKDALTGEILQGSTDVNNNIHEVCDMSPHVIAVSIWSCDT